MTLHIPDDLLLDLLRALRRHDAAESLRLLEAWAAAEREDQGDADVEGASMICLDDALSAWVHRECGLHVRAGHFEHALCLVEANRRPFSPTDMDGFLTVAGVTE